MHITIQHDRPNLTIQILLGTFQRLHVITEKIKYQVKRLTFLQFSSLILLVDVPQTLKVWETL